MSKFNFIAISNDPHRVVTLATAGVHQIMVDTETHGKAQRQSGRNAVANQHAIEDVTTLKRLRTNVSIICRINGYNSRTQAEIEAAISAGADAVMVPMISSYKQMSEIARLAGSRVDLIPLLETPYSVMFIQEILQEVKCEQVHFGLNDLSIGLGTKNIFRVLLSPVFISAVEYAAEKVKIVGVGGVGSPFCPNAVSPQLLVKHHVAMRSNAVILSRSFFQGNESAVQINHKLRLLEEVSSVPQTEGEKLEFRRQVEALDRIGN
jgi:hypothetical protein